ncbi:GATA transcription factor 4-like [Mangifera indica]|uniref:GATA transcription factor 4-like n=1 Tax=Mangifera indica TaxID=29780 RepID=UPI001CF9BCB5|nr:GATA transcription factor 4-like [Mangifera indica]
MDIYGFSTTTTQDPFRIDDLLDFSNDEIFSASSSSTAAPTHSDTTTDVIQFQLPPSQNLAIHSFNPSISTTDFTDDLCVPSDDVAELEWLSRFVDDSFSDFPKNSITGTLTVRSDTSLSGSGRGKRSKATNSITSSNTTTWTWTSETGNLKPKREIHHRQSSPSLDGGARRCTHCQSEKTPQWRTGPLGPKTLCNACGVRYKSGRLVPEYRPAASPTFVLTQHSNSHRKVLELRRQKEMLRQQQQQQGQSPSQMFRHQRDFEVC